MNGKGSKPRPVDPVKWAKNYDDIFRKKKSNYQPTTKMKRISNSANNDSLKIKH